jgi:hypothetical protein
MERINRSARPLGVCVLAAGLLFGSVGARAEAVLDWNEIAVNTAIANGQNPFAQARTAAVVQLAVFEAVNSITGDYQPYLGSIVAPHGASAEAAAIEAAYREQCIRQDLQRGDDGRELRQHTAAAGSG